MPGADDEVTNGELSRRIVELASDIRDFTQKAIMREVYEAHRLLLDARIQRLEEQRKEDLADRAAMRKLLIGGVIAFVTGIATQIITLVIAT
jgi:hypothetical protein